MGQGEDLGPLLAIPFLLVEQQLDCHFLLFEFYPIEDLIILSNQVPDAASPNSVL